MRISDWSSDVCSSVLSKTVERANSARRAGRPGIMLQLAAALLFTLAAGLGIAVILGMVKVNGEAVLSALAGEGAFPAAPGPRDRKRVVQGKSVSVRVDLGGRRVINKHTTNNLTPTQSI